MTAPMAGFGPMAWSPFPYGAVPSSGIASDKFVDLFNAQTVAGGKTFTDTLTVNKTAQAGVAEVIATFRVSDDATSKIDITSLIASDGLYLPSIDAVGTGTGTTFRIRSSAGSDAGTNPVMSFDVRTNAGAALATRPAYRWSNNGTAMMQLSAAGGLSIATGTTPSLLVGASGTAITQVRVYSQTLDPASVAANTTAEQTFTVAGLTTGDKVFINKPTNTAGLGIVNARVSAADTLAITFGNFTGVAIDAGSETYTITAIRS